MGYSQSEVVMLFFRRSIGALLLLGLCAEIPAAQIKEKNQNANSQANHLVGNKIEALVAPYVDSHNFGGNILVVRGGKVLFEQSYGMANYEHAVPVQPETKFYIASITKSFTAAAIMQHMERGRLDLDDPVSRFIPDYPSGEKIKIQHLLEHTSGIPRIFTLPDFQDISRREMTAAAMVDLMKNQPLMFEPGERYGYSGPNYHLLAYLIELISGMSYGDYVRKNLLDPLGMMETDHQHSSRPLVKNRASGYDPAGMKDLVNSAYYDYSTSVGSGSMYSTAADLHKWIKGLLSGRVLQPGSVDRIISKEDFFGRQAISLNGWSNTGFSSSLIHYPEEDITVIVLSNIDISNVTNELAAGIFAILLDESYPLFSLNENPVDPELASQIAGNYRFGDDWYSPGSSWRIVVKNGQVFGEDPDGALVGFLRIAELEFIHRGSWGRAKFERDEDRQIHRMLFYGKFWAEKIRIHQNDKAK